MDAHHADREDAATTDRGTGTPRNSSAATLPLIVRRALWRRTWDRLLAVPPADAAPAVGEEPSAEDPGTASRATGGTR